MTGTPSMWSTANPKLQIAWDATSLNALMSCPRRYQYSIIEGWTGSTVDLDFGILVHRGTETYWKRRLAGDDKEAATLEAIRVVMEESGTHEPVPTDDDDASLPAFKWKPWGGSYQNVWRCSGITKYKNKKGNAAKCPFSHAGKHFPAPGPQVCGECRSPTEHSRIWVSDNPAKDRPTAIRLVAWYCEAQPEDMENGLQPFAFPDGTPAVELPVRVPTPYKTAHGETFILAGYLDRLARQGWEHFIADVKSTKNQLNEGFFAGFSPNIQMDLYDLLGWLAFPDLNLRGIVLDGVQTLVGGSNFARRILRRSEARREELFTELGWWFKQAEGFAEADYWPMNRANCKMCPFKQICSMDPESRPRFLESNFTRRHWNPLEER